jgi:uncharacterized protein
MNVRAKALRELHRIHRQQSDLRSRLARGPKQIRAGELNVQQTADELARRKEVLKQARIAADAKQLQLRQREARIADLQGKLNACSSNREYQALQEQIAADTQANRVLEDEILESLEKLDELQAQISEANDRQNRARDELEKCRVRVNEAHQGLEQELARVTRELEEVESRLPDDFRREYRRIASVRGEDALAQVDGEVCGSCNQTLTQQTLNELRLERLVSCKSCGCLLYIAEDRAVGG